MTRHRAAILACPDSCKDIHHVSVVTTRLITCVSVAASSSSVHTTCNHSFTSS